MATVVANINKYLNDNNLDPPRNIKEYDAISSAMHTHSRAVLCNNGIICTDVLNALNPDNPVDNTRNSTKGFQYYKKIGEERGLTITKVDESIADNMISQTVPINVICNICGFTELITGTSLNRRKYGCKHCRNQSNWIYRIKEYIDICLSKQVYIDTEDIMSTIHSISVPLECMNCGTKFNRGFNTIIQDRYPIDCPSCKPQRIYGKMGVKGIYKNIEFDSKFEMDSYIILEKLELPIKLHVPYSEIIGRPSKYIADFLINEKYVLEVSSFNLSNHTEYANTIANKKELVQNSKKYMFSFCNTLAEVEKFCKEINS